MIGQFAKCSPYDLRRLAAGAKSGEERRRLLLWAQEAEELLFESGRKLRYKLSKLAEKATP